MAKLTSEQESKIVALYESGNSVRTVKIQTGHCDATIVKVIRKYRISRSISEAILLGRKNGTIITSEETRQKLRDNAKRAIRRRGKMWTKPEREFKIILNSLNLGVKFPEYAKEIFEIEDDSKPEICFQYPVQRYVCDFVDVQNRVVFRVNGDFWHANPLLYDRDKLTAIQKHNLKQDKNCHTFLIKRGWTVCDVWESEIYWNKSLVRDKIRAAREQGNPPVLRTGVARIVTEVAQSDWSDELKKLWFREPGKKKRVEIHELICQQCGTKFRVPKHNKKKMNRKYCGIRCAHIPLRKVERPSKERLKKEIAQNSWKALERKYGVSDNAIRKWARQWNLI